MDKKIPELHIGHSEKPAKQDVIVKNTMYSNAGQLEKSFPHRHSFYGIYLVRSGSGIHMIDFDEISIQPNRLFLISPYQVHFWKLDSSSHISMIQFSESLLHFDHKPLNELWFTWPLSDNYIDLNNQHSQDILELAQRLEQEIQVNDRFSGGIKRGYLTALCNMIGRMASQTNKEASPHQKEEKIQQFLRLIDQHYNQQKSVRFFAEQLHITPNYLNMLTQKNLGKSAGEIITSRIMLEAKRLLYHTMADVGQIAFQLGFEDPSYFTRAFRKQEKKTPSAFREEIYKKYQHPNN